MAKKRFDHVAEVIAMKLLDLNTPGFVAEFSPIEAEALGAFTEDAISEEDAYESSIDRHH